MPVELPISVVISTLERPDSLTHTLSSLRYQTYPEFEVIVVEGPSPDIPSEPAYSDFGDAIRHLRCPEANLSMSRNIGVAAAGGDVVAFLDDDAVAEPRWLEQLAAAYDAPDVGGAGGIVIDPTGGHPQFEFSLSDRLGFTRFDRSPPFTKELQPLADPFVYLQGTNMSFRRDRLAEAGGFDEEIEYNYDDVEVCARLIDQGTRLRPLKDAAVYHYSLQSRIRTAERTYTDPHVVIKNRVYFALRYGRRGREVDAVLHRLHWYCEEVRAFARADLAAGRLDEEQYEFFLARMDSGLERGIVAGLTGERRGVGIDPPDRSSYRPFPRRQPRGRRLRVCFLSQEFPPRDFGGIGRYTSELSRGIAELGHEVHVFTGTGDGSDQLTFEDGVWLHRMRLHGGRVPGLRGNPAATNLALVAARYQAVNALHAKAPVDLVCAASWLGEGVACSLDDRFPTITTLVTSLKTIVAVHPSLSNQLHMHAMLRLERETLACSGYLHAISQAILEDITRDFPVIGGTRTLQAPLGIADRAGGVTQGAAPDGTGLSILFVGRLERRKGVDVLLQVIPELLAEFPAAKLVVAGQDTPNTELRLGYREAFLNEHANDPALLERVRFAGQVEDAELWRLYAGCDVFCAPSRFESFGLVFLEAMMFGKPVVGCAVGGMSEIIEHETTGLLAQPGDAVSLRECLRRLLSDGEARARYGQAARARFLERYELGAATKRIVEAYSAVVQSHAATRTSPEEVTERFADVIAAVAEVDSRRALAAAGELLNPKHSLNLGTGVAGDAQRAKIGRRIIAAERFIEARVRSRRSLGHRVTDLESVIASKRREGASPREIATQAVAVINPLRNLGLWRALRRRRAQASRAGSH